MRIFNADAAYAIVGLLQLDWWPGNAKTAGNFRAERNEPDMFGQGAGDIGIFFVPAVIADFFPQQAAADTDGDLTGLAVHRCGS